VPAGSYSGLQFSIGVDQEHNDNMTLAAGELNVFRNMAEAEWMWLSSYIFAKMKGTYATGGNAESFAWETGTNDCYRTTTAPVAFAQPLTDQGGRTSGIRFRVDVSNVFAAFNPETNPAVTGTSPSNGATRKTLRGQLADAMFQMFEYEGLTAPQ